MEQEELIPAEDFCMHYNIEYSFINSLKNSGLISIKSIKRSSYIHSDEIHKLEKFVRLHYDLDINIEGIETIHYLLEKIENMQREIARLRNKL
jgi:chaperone modulatory protein CbpM